MNDSSIHEKNKRISLSSELSYTVVQTSILCLSNDAIPSIDERLILEVDARRSTMVARIHHGPVMFSFRSLDYFCFGLRVPLGSLRVSWVVHSQPESKSSELESALGSGKCSAAENRIARGSLKGSFLCTGKKRLSGREHQLKSG